MMNRTRFLTGAMIVMVSVFTLIGLAQPAMSSFGPLAVTTTTTVTGYCQPTTIWQNSTQTYYNNTIYGATTTVILTSIISDANMGLLIKLLFCFVLPAMIIGFIMGMGGLMIGADIGAVISVYIHIMPVWIMETIWLVSVLVIAKGVLMKQSSGIESGSEEDG